jgi:hypothetical protein
MNAITERLGRSWELFRRSLLVMRDNPKLLAFPALTGLLTTVIALFFLIPVGLAIAAPHWFGGSALSAIPQSLGVIHHQNGPNVSVQTSPGGMLVLGAIYLVSMFVATFCAVAFNSEILEALAGRPVSIRHGVRIACARWKSILLWSLLAGVVGLVIRALEERLSFVGRLVTGLIGLAWSVAAIFAVPILVREESTSNPIKILTRSAETIRKTWGEALVGYVGVRGANVVFALASILFWVAVGVAAYVISSPWVLLIGAAAWLPCLIAYSYLAGIASKVYLCALYVYASEGVVPSAYDESMMSMAWKTKKARA